MEHKLNRQKERSVYFDWMRIIAAIAVIAIHCCGKGSLGVTSFEWRTINFYNCLVQWAVPVFVMISGSLFLSRHRSVRQIWIRNISRLVTAFLFWSALYAAVGYDSDRGPKGFVLDLITGHYHMWFIYMIAGLYMVVPFLEKIAADRTLTSYFLLLGFIFTFIIPSVIQLISVFAPGPAGHLNTVINHIDDLYLIKADSEYDLAYEIVEETLPPEPEYAYNFTEAEEDWLLRMGMAEAGDQGIYGIALVMRVCLNRVEDSGWPSTIEGVITQPGQYSTWPGPIQNCTPSAECYEALEWIRNGWDESYGAEYFCMYYLDFSSWAEYIFSYGDHHFYR